MGGGTPAPQSRVWRRLENRDIDRLYKEKKRANFYQREQTYLDTESYLCEMENHLSQGDLSRHAGKDGGGLDGHCTLPDLPGG